ncbi:MAG: hypothetical protein EOM67_03465 [Spirochaetia bacterium]|nr:hypothetical protein [Spirochaetia bacterium]
MEQKDCFTYGQLAIVCSNLAKAAEKQTKTEMSSLFKDLSSYFFESLPVTKEFNNEEYGALVQKDIDALYSEVTNSGEKVGDRGALRCATWGKKVTSIHKSLLARYAKQKEILLEGNNVYVCEACGYIAISEQVPSLCPICKAPSSRFIQIKKGA